MQRRIIRKGLRSALMVCARRGKNQVPIGPNRLLRKSLHWKMFRVRAGRFSAAGVIGPKTGLRRVIDGKPVDPVKYAHLVHGGTKAHVIQAAPGGVLAFKTGARKRNVLQGISGRRARSVVTTRVSHPGARPTRFLQKIQVTGQAGMATAFRGKVEAELLREAAKAKPSEVDDGQ